MSHDIFRYVPQIEQTGLPVNPKIMTMLLERDRQLEDYLSTLHPGAGGAPQLSILTWEADVANNGTVHVGDSPPWTYQRNEIGLTTPWGQGILVPPVLGRFVAQAGIEWTAIGGGPDNGVGERSLLLYGFSGVGDDVRAASSTNPTKTSASLIDRAGPDLDGIYVRQVVHAAGASRHVRVWLSILFWAG